MSNPSSRRETLYRIIRSKILTDEYEQGQKLSENTLAQEYGCSRTPIREILTWLKNDGLVVVVPKSGTYVRTETEEDVTELVQVRSYLESLAFRLAVTEASDHRIQRVSKIFDELEAIVRQTPIDLLRFASLHYEFHFQLVLASGNALLQKMYARLNLRSSHMFYRSMDRSAAEFTQNEHRRILEYLRSRDPSGEPFVREHLLRRY